VPWSSRGQEDVREALVRAMQEAKVDQVIIKTPWFRLFIPEAIPWAVKTSNGVRD
jgi:hypothetical protein